jgi:ABC-type nickel/cobalt efflux system permease component RcnA
MTLAAGILGGTLSAGTHAVKAGTRVMVNTSPEPFSNWVLSISEDLVVIGGIWAAVQHPWFFLISLGLFLLVAIWMIPRLLRGIQMLFRRLTNPAKNSPKIDS